MCLQQYWYIHAATAGPVLVGTNVAVSHVFQYLCTAKCHTSATIVTVWSVLGVVIYNGFV